VKWPLGMRRMLGIKPTQSKYGPTAGRLKHLASASAKTRFVLSPFSFLLMALRGDASPQSSPGDRKRRQRIGWHVAKALAIHYRSSATEATQTVVSFRSQGIEAFELQADLTDEKAVRSLIGQILERCRHRFRRFPQMGEQESQFCLICANLRNLWTTGPAVFGQPANVGLTIAPAE
jgi:hypothetical protein